MRSLKETIRVRLGLALMRLGCWAMGIKPTVTRQRICGRDRLSIALDPIGDDHWWRRELVVVTTSSNRQPSRCTVHIE